MLRPPNFARRPKERPGLSPIVRRVVGLLEVGAGELTGIDRYRLPPEAAAQLLQELRLVPEALLSQVIGELVRFGIYLGNELQSPMSADRIFQLAASFGPLSLAGSEASLPEPRRSPRDLE